LREREAKVFVMKIRKEKEQRDKVKAMKLKCLDEKYVKSH
jgi:hypothetical protein